MSRKKIAAILVLFISLAMTTSGGAKAGPNLVLNGSFTDISQDPNAYTPGSGQIVNPYFTTAQGAVTVSDWTSTGYNFLFASGAADTTGGIGQYGFQHDTPLPLYLWGPNDGAPVYNTLPASSPDGGNYIAANGDSNFSGAIQQTISGLNVGTTYTVGFWWAGAQQKGYYGDTSEQWQVSFGGQTQLTPSLPNLTQGFTGWVYQTLTFQADSTSDVLSFLSIGMPGGVPPFALLDGVTVESPGGLGPEGGPPAASPEPSTMVIIGTGLIGASALRRLRRSKSAAA